MLVEIKPLYLRTEEEKAVARQNDLPSHKHLKSLGRFPQNRECADCRTKNPGWAALPHGVFICVDCAQVHRGLGTHISRVKSICSGTYMWFDDEIAAMETIGNERSNSFYLGKVGVKPGLSSSREEIARHIREKYVSKLWYEPPSKVMKFDSGPAEEAEVSTCSIPVVPISTTAGAQEHSVGLRGKTPPRRLKNRTNGLGAVHIGVTVNQDAFDWDSCPSPLGSNHCGSFDAKEPEQDLLTFDEDVVVVDTFLHSNEAQTFEHKKAKILSAFPSDSNLFFKEFGL